MIEPALPTLLTVSKEGALRLDKEVSCHLVPFWVNRFYLYNFPEEAIFGLRPLFSEVCSVGNEGSSLIFESVEVLVGKRLLESLPVGLILRMILELRIDKSGFERDS